MQWLAMIMCLCAGVASARTEEEDQQQASSGVSSSLPEPCFYRQPIDCPIESDRCPCKRITLANGPEGNAALCCNIDEQALEYGLSCIGGHYSAENPPLNLTEWHKFRCDKSCDRALSLLYFYLMPLRISTFEHKLCTYT